MFRRIELSSGEIQDIVLLHAVSAHSVGSRTVYRNILALNIIFNYISEII
jgi:hypothetical protein